MTDIAIQWQPAEFRGDWSVANGGLATDPGLEPAVLVSLFTWRRASADYVPPAGSDTALHGWWADSYSDSPIGSRLWQLRRVKKTDETTLLNRARDYCVEALQWLIDDGVASAVRVTTWWLTPDSIGIQVEIARPAGTATFRYGWAWGA
jgi:phage gp46-like protein